MELTTAERVVALTALQKAIRDELDSLRAEAKIEMMEAGETKNNVSFAGHKVGDVRLITEQVSHIEVYPTSTNPTRTWDLLVSDYGDEQALIKELLGGNNGKYQ